VTLIASTKLTRAGFRWIGARQSFVRAGRDFTHVFRPIVYRGQIAPSVAIRCEAVERRLHRVSREAPALRRSSVTVSAWVGVLHGGEILDCAIERDAADPVGAARFLERVFARDAEPFFARYSSLERLEPVLNGEARLGKAPLAYAEDPLRGLVAAKLRGRADLAALVARYARRYGQRDDPPYRMFEALVASLGGDAPPAAPRHRATR
jgi:hypothetical protein